MNLICGKIFYIYCYKCEEIFFYIDLDNMECFMVSCRVDGFSGIGW